MNEPLTETCPACGAEIECCPTICPECHERIRDEEEESES